jgi:hypothetical protein
LLSSSANTWAGDAPVLQATVGVKAWDTEWSSWDPVQDTTTGVRVIQPVNSDYHVAVIPQVSLRYGDWLASGSYFAKTTYTLSGSLDQFGIPSSLSISRQEVDANAGYYIFPSLAVTLGYKRIEQDVGNVSYVWSGPTIGLAGSAVLHSNWALYGTFAFGVPRMHTLAADDANNTSFSTEYYLGEFGLAYVMRTSPGTSVSLTLGYRTQVVITNDYAIFTGHGGYTYVDVHDVTQGPAFGVLGRF